MKHLLHVIAISLALAPTSANAQFGGAAPVSPQPADHTIDHQSNSSSPTEDRLDQAFIDRVTSRNVSPEAEQLDAEWLDRALGHTAPSSRAAQQAQLNLNQSLEAIVRSDSRGWASHTYDLGSMRGAQIRTSSADGSTYVARGYYTYNGGRQGWVDAQVSNGRLVCIEYWNSWSGCRRPNGPGSNSYAGAIAIALVVAVLAVASMSAEDPDDDGWAAADLPDAGGGPSNRRSTDQDREPLTPAQPPIAPLYTCANPPCWDLARDPVKPR
jgi:hypothetical protein